MREQLGRFRLWLGSLHSFEIVIAVAGAVLLALLESRTPLDIQVRYLGNNTFAYESPAIFAGLQLSAQIASVLLVLAPLVALRSLVLAVLFVVPRLVVGLLSNGALAWTAYAALVIAAVGLSWRRPRAAWAMAALATCLPAAVIAARGRLMIPGGSVEFGPPLVHKSPFELAFVIALYVVATAMVMFVAWLLKRESQHRVEALALERGRRDVSRDAALVGERSRLARDLHDVVAHHVSLIAVRAETAPYTYPDLSADARLILSEIASDSRTALDELRGVLGVLRRSDDAGRRTPQPSAIDINGLVLKAQSATDVVSASLQGLETVRPTPGYVAYRVVQEALTNARRHAPGAPVDVTAHGDGAGGIRVLITNRVRQPVDAQPVDAQQVDAPPVDAPPVDAQQVDAQQVDAQPGRGLTGMAERVAAVGGELETGVRAGEFVVDARLPAVHRHDQGLTS